MTSDETAFRVQRDRVEARYARALGVSDLANISTVHEFRQFNTPSMRGVFDVVVNQALNSSELKNGLERLAAATGSQAGDLVDKLRNSLVSNRDTYLGQVRAEVSTLEAVLEETERTEENWFIQWDDYRNLRERARAAIAEYRQQVESAEKSERRSEHHARQVPRQGVSRWARILGRRMKHSGAPHGGAAYSLGDQAARALAAQYQRAMQLRREDGFVDALAPLHEREETALKNLREALLEKAIFPAARVWINDLLEKNRRHAFRNTLDVQDVSGLRQLTSADHEVPTVAFRQLRDLARHVGGGTIGISGPRGVGKTTILDAFCTGRQQISDDSSAKQIGVLLAAPVRYEPRDFLLHLFAELCRSVIGPDDTIETNDPLRSEGASPRSFVSTLTGLGIFLLLMGGVWIARATAAPPSASSAVVPVSLLIFLLVLAAVAGGAVPSQARWVYVSLFAAASVTSAWEGLASTGEKRLALLLHSAGFMIGAAAAIASAILRWKRGLRPSDEGSLLEIAPAVLPVGLGAAIAASMLARDDAALADQFIQGVGLIVAAAVLELLLGRWTFPLPPRPSTGDRAILISPEARLEAEMRLAGTTASFSTLLGGTVLTLLAATNIRMSGQLVVGMAATIVGVHLIERCRIHYSLSRTSARPKWDREESMVVQARQALNSVRYQQTLTRGWSGAVKLGTTGIPLAIERTFSGQNSYQRLQRTFPELVGEYQRFVRELATESPVIIGIDELDKLRVEDARRFIDDIRAVLDVRTAGCYFLVSVSEDAMVSFEQRGVPIRDVFDTAFDTMLRVEHLSIEGSRELLRKRIIDLPVGFASLAHVLAGGLARDLIRATRRIMAVRDSGRGTELSVIASAAAAAELRDRAHALEVLARNLSEPTIVVALLDWCHGLTFEDTASLKSLDPRLCSVLAGTGDVADAARIAQAHATSYYHLETVSAFFNSAEAGDIAAAASATDERSFDRLAASRQMMATNWALAWSGITEFRAGWSMDILPRPDAWNVPNE